MFDAAALAFASGLSELVVQRAVGTAPVKATVALDTNKITVTAKEVGAFANAWTVAYTTSTKTLTIIADTTEVYTGATAAELASAAAASKTVTVTVSALPGSNVAATNLAAGTDDFANVSWAAELARLSGDFGPGAVWIPGVVHTSTAAALAAHCAAAGRVGLVTAAQGATKVTLTAAAATVAAVAGSERLILVGPWASLAGSAPMDPCGFVAGLRAMAQTIGAGENPRQESFAKRVVDVTPEFEFTSSDWSELESAGVSTIRTVHGVTRLYGYQTVKAPGGNVNLRGAQRRDLVNAIRFNGESILAAHDGKAATTTELTVLRGELEAMVATVASGYLTPRIATDGAQIDPGYRVTVTTGTDPADNRIAATIALRAAESIDDITFTIALGDAGATL